MKRLITAEYVVSQAAAGQKRIAVARRDSIITPAAWSKARDLGVVFDEAVQDAPGAGGAPRPAVSPTPASDPGSCERVVDPSGLLVVRGRSVRLGRFSGAGEGRNIGLTDLVTGRDGSPMTAGMMSWAREDSFPWTLDYDEIDFVLEGVLQISIDGRVLEGRPGDVFYIPKGSRIVFGTPSRTRVFYVTYPADWSAAASAPPRPQK